MFHSIFFKVPIKMDDFYSLSRPPSPCRLKLFFLFARWGLGVFHLLQDCRPDLEIAAQCEKYQQCLFLSFKGTRD